MWGRSVTIAITGIDSRLGVEQAHADANHVLRIWLDQGRIEIISVPRGTYADAGFSSSSLNIIANYRARKGRAAYLRKLAEMTGVGKIDYYVEVGFSQAMGIFELLGFKGSAATTLHVLRTRKAFGIGDHQRCYNQAQFIRQMILKHFPRSEGVLDALALRGALALAQTNLPYNVAQGIIAALRAKGFPRSERDVRIELRPRRFRVKDFDFRSPDKVIELGKSFDRALKKRVQCRRSQHSAPRRTSNDFTAWLLLRHVHSMRANQRAHLLCLSDRMSSEPGFSFPMSESECSTWS